MSKLLDNVTEFKQLVLDGFPKLFNAEEFTEDEQEAVSLYIQRYGIQMDSYTGRVIVDGGLKERPEYVGLLLQGITLEIHNTFKGHYGI